MTTCMVRGKYNLPGRALSLALALLSPLLLAGVFPCFAAESSSRQVQVQPSNAKGQIKLRPEDSILRVAPKYKGMGPDQFEKAIVYVLLKTWPPVPLRTLQVRGRWFEIRLALEAGLNVYYCVRVEPTDAELTLVSGDKVVPEDEIRIVVYDNHGNWENEFILCYRAAGTHYFSAEAVKNLRFVKQGIMQNLGSIVPLHSGTEADFAEVFPDYSSAGDAVPSFLIYRGKQYVKKGDIWMTLEGDPLERKMQRELNVFYEAYLQNLQGGEELRLGTK